MKNFYLLVALSLTTLSVIPAHADGGKSTVTFNIVNDDSECKFDHLTVYNSLHTFNNGIYFMYEGNTAVEVDPGVYDICAFFENLDEYCHSSGMPIQRAVIIENVDITADAAVTVDAAAATHTYRFNSVNHEGTRDVLSVYDPETETVITDNATCREIDVENHVVCDGVGYVGGFGGGTDIDFGPGKISEAFFDYQANRPSDRYHFTQMRSVYYFSTGHMNFMRLDGVCDGVAVNKPADFVRVSTKEMIAATPAAEKGMIYDEDRCVSVKGTVMLGETNSLGGPIIDFPRYPDIYIDCPWNDDRDNWMITLSSIEKSDGVEIEAGITAPPFRQVGNEARFLLANGGEAISAYNNGEPNPNPYIRQDFSTSELHFGDSPAWLTYYNNGHADEETGPFHYAYPMFYGNCGEARTIDMYESKISVKADGKEVFDRDDNEYTSWLFDWLDSRPGPSAIVSRIENRNRADGGMTTAEIIYDEKSDDLNVPNITYLRLADADGLPHTAFPKGEAPVIALYAADFSFEGDGPTASPVARLEVGIRPTGTSDFEEIAMTEDPDKEYPGYGYYYESQLSALSDGAYDLKLHLEDNTGNIMRQIITRAFTIGESSIDTVIAEPLSQDSGVEVFTLSGSRIKTTDLVPGIYIVRRGDKTSKVVVR